MEKCVRAHTFHSATHKTVADRLDVCSISILLRGISYHAPQLVCLHLSAATLERLWRLFWFCIASKGYPKPRFSPFPEVETPIGDTKDPQLCTSYCPISLYNSKAKVFAKILMVTVYLVERAGVPCWEAQPAASRVWLIPTFKVTSSDSWL